MSSSKNFATATGVCNSFARGRVPALIRRGCIGFLSLGVGFVTACAPTAHNTGTLVELCEPVPIGSVPRDQYSNKFEVPVECAVVRYFPTIAAEVGATAAQLDDRSSSGSARSGGETEPSSSGSVAVVGPNGAAAAGGGASATVGSDGSAASAGGSSAAVGDGGAAAASDDDGGSAASVGTAGAAASGGGSAATAGQGGVSASTSGGAAASVGSGGVSAASE